MSTSDEGLNSSCSLIFTPVYIQSYLNMTTMKRANMRGTFWHRKKNADSKRRRMVLTSLAVRGFLCQKAALKIGARSSATVSRMAAPSVNGFKDR